MSIDTLVTAVGQYGRLRAKVYGINITVNKTRRSTPYCCHVVNTFASANKSVVYEYVIVIMLMPTHGDDILPLRLALKKQRRHYCTLSLRRGHIGMAGCYQAMLPTHGNTIDVVQHIEQPRQGDGTR